MPDTHVFLFLAIAFYVVCALYVVGWAIHRRRVGIFSPFIQCVAFISLFTLPLPIRAYQTLAIEGDVTAHLPQIYPYLPASVSYTAIGLLFFKAAYFSGIAKQFGHWLPHPPTVRRPKGIRAFVLVGGFSIFLLTVLAKTAGGLLPFILLGYGSTSETFGRGYLAVGFPWAFVATLFLIYQYAHTRKRFVLLAFIVAFAITLLAQVILGNRAGVMYMALTVLFFTHYAVRRIRLRTLLPIGVAGFLGLNVMGTLRNSGYESIAEFSTRSAETASRFTDSGNLKGGLYYTMTTGEFVVPFETFPQMIASVTTEISPAYGRTFLMAPLFFVPSAIFPNRPQPLGNWYMSQFYGRGFGANEGRAFFFLAEGYLNLGPAGVMLVAIAWGVLFGGIATYIKDGRRNPGSLLLASLSVAFIFRAVAGDSVTLLVGLAEQSLVAAALGLWIATRYKSWIRNSPVP